MVQTLQGRFGVRQATEADIPVLAEIKPPVALHRDRLRDADGGALRYLVVHDASVIVGFGLIVFEWPNTWPDSGAESRLPGLLDLYVRPDRRGHGAGSCLIARMEEIIRSCGGTHVYLDVDPIENPRAYQLYRRLGYTPMQAEPYREHWSFTDSDGNTHEGDEWAINMMKELG